MIDDAKLPAVYWLTRDRRHGELSDIVGVWTALPRRHRYPDGDVEWLPPDEHLFSAVAAEPSCAGEWTVAEAKLRVGPGAPDTDAECTRVGKAVPQ